MKPDVLERLVMDSALKRLDPDVEILLADYLSNDPEVAGEANELQELLHLATEAVRQPAPVIEMPNQIHQLVWRHRTEQFLAIAAAFVIGVGFTTFLLHTNLHPENIAAARAPTTAAFHPAPASKEIASLPFWSNQRIYLLASAANSKENVP